MKFTRYLDYAKLAMAQGGSKLLPEGIIKYTLENQVSQRLTQLRGVPAKINQILLMKKGESLNAEPLPFEEVKPEDAQLDILLEPLLISKEVKAASLGQVHFFRNPEAQDLALKIRYPGALEWLKMDNRVMDMAVQSFEAFKSGFDLKEYKEFFQKELEGELNYQAEFSVQHKLFDFWSKENHQIVIPRPISCSDGWIMMRREDSLSLEEFKHSASSQQLKVAQNLILEFYLKSLFLLGIVHSDPNPGNFGFRISHDIVSLVVYDFGSVTESRNKAHHYLLWLILNPNASASQVLFILGKLNFQTSKLSSFSDCLSVMFQILFEPLQSPMKYVLNNWKRSERIKSLLADDRMQFMTSAPMELFPYMRMFHGVFFYLNQLGESVYASPLLNDIHGRMSPSLGELEIGEEVNHDEFYLKIQVFESNKQKVKLTFPARSIHALEDIIPPEIVDKLTDQGVNLMNIKQKALRMGLNKQTLFEIEWEKKKVLVQIDV